MASKAWAGSTGRTRTRTAEWRTLAPRIRARDHNTCQLCGSPGHPVDHITPHAEGGTDTPDNLRTLCQACHTAKTATEAARGRARLAAKAKRQDEPHPGIRRS